MTRKDKIDGTDELDGFICNICNQRHEFCYCGLDITNEDLEQTPMCCGVPLRDDKCQVCADQYDD